MTSPSIEVTMHEIHEAAKRIDPHTAEMIWWYAEGCDPYRLGLDRPDEPGCIGREYFLIDPSEQIAVLVYEVRKLHSEISDREWDELMRAAAKRDTTPDPMPFFHLYR